PRADQEDRLVAEDLRGDDHAGLDDAVVGRRADDRSAQQRGQRTDAGLDLALLLLGRVVAAVLLEVALFASRLDALRDLRPALAGELLELCRQTVVCLLGEP